MAPAAAIKAYRTGTDRLVPPAETLSRVRPFMPAMGITRIANVTGLDPIGVPVTVVCRPNSRGLATSQGKGLTLDAAKASGLMESIESYHAEHIQLPLRLGTHAEIAARHNSVIDVDGLPRPVTSRFHANLPMLWLEGVDLVSGKSMWVPYECVTTDYTTEHRPGFGCFIRSSNGLASGNHWLEALSHAICEVIERDAGNLWSLLGDLEQQRTRIDLATIDDPGCLEVIERCHRAGVEVGAWESTAEIDVPSFIAVINDASEDPGRVMYTTYGSGCHPRREIAMLRALTEAVQSRLTLITGTREDLPRTEYDRLLQRDGSRRMHALIGGSAGTRGFGGGAGWSSGSFEEDVGRLVDLLRAAGMEQVVAVDLTIPDFGIPVARVVVPWLEMDRSLPDVALGRRARRWAAQRQ